MERQTSAAFGVRSGRVKGSRNWARKESSRKEASGALPTASKVSGVLLTLAGGNSEQFASIVENYADERAVNAHAAAVIVNEAQLPVPIHKVADARTRGANHFGKGLLAHVGDNRYWLGFFPSSRAAEEAGLVVFHWN